MSHAVKYEMYIGLPTEPLLAALLDLHISVIKGQTRDEVSREWVYQEKRGPLLVNVALVDGQVIGFKLGYERKAGQFYSWLGCVDSAYRGQGIADALMRQQHEWCIQQGYVTVRTQTYNQWRGMLILNLKFGFNIIGTQQGAHGLIILLEKRLLTA